MNGSLHGMKRSDGVAKGARFGCLAGRLSPIPGGRRGIPVRDEIGFRDGRLLDKIHPLTLLQHLQGLEP